MAEKYAHILISGRRVQKVMFREYIRDLAVKHDLLGEVHNVHNYHRDVMVICEGEERRIRDFIRELDTLREEKRPEEEERHVLSESEKMLIRVDKVDVSFYDHRGIFDDFTVIRSADEAGERFAGGGQQIAALRVETRSNFDMLERKYGEFSEALKNMPKEIAKELREIMRQ